ncbi:GNAT family N-acetyltransferase [Azorhizobium sp. AG788]|uniref:GNAT family N-acetyltransferase n=1 Tax=Azorhizobium sp. AG788 TaxID=2183897 RepID=UPI00313873D7
MMVSTPRPSDGAAGAAGRLRLRPQTPEDAGFLRLLFGEGRRAEMAAAGWPEAMAAAFLDDQFRLQSAHYARAHPDADFRIAERAGRPVGRLAVDWGGDGAGTGVHVIDIALRAAVQGRGIGTGLLRQVIAAAGARPVTLQVVRGARAAGLYARLGFVACGPAGGVHETLRRVP